MIIEAEELAEIAAEFGPNTTEDVAYILTPGARVADGSGYRTTAPSEDGPYGCRIIYVGNMTVRERQEAGQVATAGDYIMSLPAGVFVPTNRIVRVKARPWQADKRYMQGAKVTPVDGSNKIFHCIDEGTSGELEPAWNSTAKGNHTVDNTATWVYFGPGEDYQVIQKAGPGTYGDYFSTKYAVTLAQDTTGK